MRQVEYEQAVAVGRELQITREAVGVLLALERAIQGQGAQPLVGDEVKDSYASVVPFGEIKRAIVRRSKNVR